MRNRDRLYKCCPYDMILQAQKELQEQDVFCILQLLGLTKAEVIARCSGLCELCIERWMNEDERGVHNG